MIHWFSCILVFLTLICGAAAQGKKKDEPKKEKTPLEVLKSAKRVPIPNDAISLAAIDIDTLPLLDRLFTRYLFFKETEYENAQAVFVTISYLSRNTDIVDPKTWVIMGGGIVMRLDLRCMAVVGRSNEITEILEIWEELRYDPAMSKFLTPDLIKALIRTNKDLLVRIHTKDWQLVDKDKSFDGGKTAGRWISPIVCKEVRVEELKDEQLVELEPEHVDPLLYTYLQNQTLSLAPVVSYDYFIARGLSTIQDKGIFKTIFGGLYYEFVGLKSGSRKKGTDEEGLFGLLFLGDFQAEIDVGKIFDNIRSDQRLAMWRSNVTGNWRRVSWLPTPQGHNGNVGIVFISNDVRSQDIDLQSNPLLNLVKFNVFAKEIIYTRTNGTYGQALVDKDGKFAREVPPDVAVDRTIPPPHHPRLEGIISCMRCHDIPDFALGLQPMQNDVKTLLKSRTNIYADLTDEEKTVEDTNNRIRNWYLGDPTELMLRVKSDLAKSRLRAAGPWKKGGDQTKIVRLSTEQIALIYKRHKWDMIGSAEACYELGFQVAAEDAKALLWLLLPPEFAESDGAVIPQDPRLSALKAGIPINRVDWALVYSYAASRANRSVQLLRRGGHIQ